MSLNERLLMRKRNVQNKWLQEASPRQIQSTDSVGSGCGHFLLCFIPFSQVPLLQSCLVLEEMRVSTVKQLRNSASCPRKCLFFFLPTSYNTTILITTPDPISLSSLEQSQELLTSSCGMLIEKAAVAIRCVSNTKVSLLDKRKIDEQIVLCHLQ